MVIEKMSLLLGSSPQWLLAQPSYMGWAISASRPMVEAGDRFPRWHRCFPGRIRLTSDETPVGEGSMTLPVPRGIDLEELDGGKLTEEGSRWQQRSSDGEPSVRGRTTCHRRRLTSQRAARGRGKSLGQFGWTRELSEKVVMVEVTVVKTRMARTPQSSFSRWRSWTGSSTRGCGTVWGGHGMAGLE
jgi:hypothetical protein